MILSDWITRYELKTGEPFFVPEGFQLAFGEQHGFFCFKADCKDGVTFVNVGPACVLLPE